MAERLTGAAREAGMAGLPGWTLDPDRDAIGRSFRFAGFTDAFAFMTAVALEASQADHHPEWRNVWNRVDVLLTTHSAGGLTAKDLALAARADALAERFAPD